MISCEEAVRELWAYLEQDLDARDRRRIDHHLARCRRCCGEAEFAEALRELLRSSATPHLPADVELRLLDFLDATEREAPWPRT